MDIARQSIVDLWCHGANWYPTAPARFYDYRAPCPPGLEGENRNRYRVLTPLSTIDKLWFHYYNYGAFGDRTLRHITAPLAFFIPNTNIVERILNAEGYDVLRVRWYERILRIAEREVDSGRPGGHVNALSARYLVTIPEEPEEGEYRPRILLNKHALPRAFLTDGHGLHLPLAELSSATVPRLGSLAITHSRSNWIELRTQASRDSHLVLLDTLFPGWYVALDGRPASLTSAWNCFRTVKIPGGAHVVRMVYYPAAFKVGFYLTLLGLCMVAGLVAMCVVRRPNSR